MVPRGVRRQKYCAHFISIKGAEKITEFMHFCCLHPIHRQICRKNPHSGIYMPGILSIAPHNFTSAGSSSRSLTSLPGRVRLRVFLYLYYPHIMTNGGMSPRFPLLTFAILITLFQSLIAQDRPTTGLGGGTGRNIADHLLIQEANKTLYDAPEENVIGSPFLVRDFVKGNIRSSKGKFEGVEMRYN